MAAAFGLVYGNGKTALRGLSFELRAGECFALLGRNGAGKTTALAVLSGQLPPSGGFVLVGGVQVAGRPEAARRRVALCPQTNPLLPLLSVSEHLALYSALYGITVAAALVRRCGLTSDLMDRPAGQLSGGSQRKLSLAIALMARPQLLLLDEPSAGMCCPARRSMCDAINMAVRGALGASGGGGSGAEAALYAPAVVLSTHYGEECLALCDAVGVMEAGRLLAVGPPQRVPRLLPGGHYLADPEEWGGALTPLLGE